MTEIYLKFAALGTDSQVFGPSQQISKDANVDRSCSTLVSSTPGSSPSVVNAAHSKLDSSLVQSHRVVSSTTVSTLTKSSFISPSMAAISILNTPATGVLEGNQLFRYH